MMCNRYLWRLVFACVLFGSCSARAEMQEVNGITRTLASEDFSVDEGDFTGSLVTQAPAYVGPDEELGGLYAANNASATLSFEAQDSGLILVEFWVWVNDTNTYANTGGDIDVLLMNAGDSITSGNSCGAIKITRDTTETGGEGAPDASYFKFARRTSAGWAYIGNRLLRQQWHKLGILYDIDNHTFDLISQGQRIRVGEAAARGTAPSEVSRVVLNAAASVQVTRFDNFRVAKFEHPQKKLLIEHSYIGSGSVASSTPERDRSNLTAQAPTVPTDTTTYSVPSLSANGLTFDATDPTFVAYNVRPDCIAAADWTLSAAGDRWFGVVARSYNWRGSNDDAYYEANYDSSRASNQLRLYMGQSDILAQKAASYTGDVTVELECNGNNLEVRVNGTTELTHTIFSDATGARGLLCERICGPSWPGGLDTDNYCTAFRGYGADESIQLAKRIGEKFYEITPGSVRQVYDPAFGSALPYTSRGLSQFVHTAQHDMGEDGACWAATMYDGDGLFSQRQRGWMIKETSKSGYGDAYITMTPRGLWTWETATLTDIGAGLTFTPDQDFNPKHLSGTSFLTCQGDATTPDTRTRSFTNWTQPEVIGTNNWPAGFQVLQQDTGYLRTSVMQVSSTPGDWSWHHGYMNIGDGTAASHTVPTGSATHSEGDTVEVYRWAILGNETALDASFLSDMRADMDSPAALTVGGDATLTTDADGDAGTDGFNERYGWYEVDWASGSSATIALDGVADRVQAQFHFENMTTKPGVLVGAEMQRSGIDYHWSDDGNGGKLLTFTGTLDASATITLLQTVPRFPVFKGN